MQDQGTRPGYGERAGQPSRVPGGPRQDWRIHVPEDAMNPLSRRQLLNAMGLGSGTLFLPSLMGDKQAYAQAQPKRLVIFYTQHGPGYENWRMRRPGLPDKDGDW